MTFVELPIGTWFIEANPRAPMLSRGVRIKASGTTARMYGAPLAFEFKDREVIVLHLPENLETK